MTSSEGLIRPWREAAYSLIAGVWIVGAAALVAELLGVSGLLRTAVMLLVAVPLIAVAGWFARRVVAWLFPRSSPPHPSRSITVDRDHGGPHAAA